MELEEAIRSRRTHKAYGPEPVDRETLDELFELARWAPNHHLTNPWRFRVLGPRALEALKEAAGPESARKLDRAPTLVAASVVQTGDEIADEEDFAAGACASFIVLLGAHARGARGVRDRGRRARARPAAPRPGQGGEGRARARPARRLPDLPGLTC